MAFASVFTNLTAADFPTSIEESEIVEVEATDNMNDAFKKLCSSNVLSAPVWDQASKKYLGFFDVADAMALVYSVDLLASLIPQDVTEDSRAGKYLREHHKKGEKMVDLGLPKDATVDILFEDGMRDDEDNSAWFPVKMNSPMWDVLTLLSRKTRRVPVLNEQGRVVKIISQSSVTEVLYNKVLETQKSGGRIPDVLNEKLNEQKFGYKEVICIGEEEPVKKAFAIIIEKGLSAVGVTNDEYELFSCITTKDVRLFESIESAAIQRLSQSARKRRGTLLMELSAADFISHARKISDGYGAARPSVIVVTPNTEMKTVIGKLAAAKVHRVFIVDDKRRPLGVISVSDIVTRLVDELSMDT